jgi:hypothetical protein
MAIASLFVPSRLRIEECRESYFLSGAEKTTAKSIGLDNLFPLRQFAIVPYWKRIYF